MPALRLPLSVLLIAAACVAAELALLGADFGLWGTVEWRPAAYFYGAFWRGLLFGWRPNFPLQPWTMFVTYAFLHAGFMHLLVNVVTLASLGAALVARAGERRFLVIYAVSVVSGGVGFAFLSDAIRPMVGASGALFGLAGAWVVWDVADTVSARVGPARLAVAILWPIGVLTLMNVVMYAATGGLLAWETHLGGFLGGAAVALVMLRRAPF